MKKFFVFFLVLSLLIPNESFAGKGSSSSGRSFSSGSKSFSSSSGRSFSSGSKSFSGSSSSKPSFSGSSGKSYSSGSNSTSKPSAIGSNGSSSKPSTSVPQQSKSTVAGTNGKNYTSPSSSSSASSSNDTNSRKPASTTFNKTLSDQAKREESKTKYQASKTVASPSPKPTFTTPAGKTLQSNTTDVQTVRNYVTHERYITYDNRASGFYGGFYSRPVYYNDSFSPFLTGWLLSDLVNRHDRALWIYHHENDMDRERYQYLISRDAQLQAEINQLRAQNLARNPSYVPPQMSDNPDLMYNKEFVDAAYNPEIVQENLPATPVQENLPEIQQKSSNSMIYWTIITVMIIGGCAGLCYLLFLKDF